MSRPALVIWQDSSEWGGVDVLVQRLSAFLLAAEFPHKVVQAHGSRLWEELAPEVRATPDEAADWLAEAEVVLLPSIAKMRSLTLMLQDFGGARVIGWVVQPTDVLTAFFPFASKVLPLIGLRSSWAFRRLFPRHFRTVEQAFRRLMEGQGLLFMDGATRRQFDDLFPALSKVEAPLLPIPSPLGTGVAGSPGEADGVLRIGYLGRVDDMKWSALGSLISATLAPLAQQRTIRLVAVAEGSRMADLRSACDRAGIELDERGFLPNAEARHLLAGGTDVILAMGTAALDLAACGKPVIIIDPVLRRSAPPQRLFRFLHEAEDFCLGEFRDAPSYVPGLRSFADCLAMVGSPDLPERAGRYVRECHDPDRIFERLLRLLEQSSAKAGALKQDMLAIDRSFRKLSPRYRRSVRRSSAAGPSISSS